jgi:hypothetical protein
MNVLKMLKKIIQICFLLHGHQELNLCQQKPPHLTVKALTILSLERQSL